MRPGLHTLHNGTVELDVLVDGGPRVLRYALAGGHNAFHVVPGAEGPGFKLRGGHRLWIAPEDPLRTYVPDDAPVHHEPMGRGHRFTAPTDAFGLEKTLEITLAPEGSEVEVIHRVTHRGTDPQELAAWALTVLAPGGRAIVPLPPAAPHPGSAARSAADFAPRITMSLWPYLRFDDPRLAITDRRLVLHQTDDPRPAKLGLVVRAGWAGSWNDGLWFVKRFSYVEGARYPDGGVNFETYTDARFLELETLSPLVSLAPGTSLVHAEIWTLEDGVPLESVMG